MKDCIALLKMIDPPIDKSIGIQYHLVMMNTSYRYDVFGRDQRQEHSPSSLLKVTFNMKTI
jgi:hypothetical protein